MCINMQLFPGMTKKFAGNFRVYSYKGNAFKQLLVKYKLNIILMNVKAYHVVSCSTIKNLSYI